MGIIGCGQIGFNHRLPLLVLHAHDETVLGNAGIIDEHINAAVFGHDVVDGLLRSFSITDIEHNAAAAAFKGFASASAAKIIFSMSLVLNQR